MESLKKCENIGEAWRLQSERLAELITTEEMAREGIITLFQRVSKLTVKQEKKLHEFGRKVHKKFGMKPVNIIAKKNFDLRRKRIW